MAAMAVSPATRAFTLLATAIRLFASVVAALMVVYAGFILFEANPANVLVRFTSSAYAKFGWFTQDLFTITSNPKYGAVINVVLAAVIYVVVGSLISKLIVRLAPPEKAKAKS
jgi:ABC-type transport system involved in multi-copper enzyme maturation permease subunit